MVQFNGRSVNAILDTGAINSYVSKKIAKRLKLPITETFKCINLAVKGCSSQTIGACKVTVELQQQKYKSKKKQKFTVLKNLLSDVVLGQDFINQHKTVRYHFGSTVPPAYLKVLKALKVTNSPLLFQHLTKYCQPIARKPRRHSNANRRFIMQIAQISIAD